MLGLGHTGGLVVQDNDRVITTSPVRIQSGHLFHAVSPYLLIPLSLCLPLKIGNIPQKNSRCHGPSAIKNMMYKEEILLMLS